MVEKINIIKDSKIFKFFYSNSKGTDEENKKFGDSYKKLIDFIDTKDKNIDEYQNFRDYVEENLKNKEFEKQLKELLKKLKKKMKIQK